MVETRGLIRERMDDCATDFQERMRNDLVQVLNFDGQGFALCSTKNQHFNVFTHDVIDNLPKVIKGIDHSASEGAMTAFQQNVAADHPSFESRSFRKDIPRVQQTSRVFVSLAAFFLQLDSQTHLPEFRK